MAKKQEEIKPGLPAWQGTFGDLMNLLLCFFVLLFSMSNMDAEKFEALAASFSNTFSILKFGSFCLIYSTKDLTIELVLAFFISDKASLLL